MLPGISGSLLAPTFLEQWIDSRVVHARDTTQRFRPLHQWWTRVERTLGPTATVRTMADAAVIPLLEQRGYTVLHLEPFAEGLVGTAARNERALVAIRVAPWQGDLDREWRTTVRAGRVAGARWALVFVGHTLRVVDAGRAWSRRSLDFRLEAVFRDERSARAFVDILDAAGNTNAQASLAAVVAASERYGTDVCAALGAGVLDAVGELYAELRRAARRGSDTRAAFEQAVTVVYRLLFLLFAEARAMVPTWHQIYRDSYTVDALCRQALTTPARPGLWKGLQAITRLAHRGCRAGDLVVTPFNGRLFSPAHTPLAERTQVSERAVGHALVSLATTSNRGSRERIAYGDLGVEQLGAVYERLLEYEPASCSSTAALARTAIERKATGSFYTPRAVTDFLVRRALHPLVAGKRSDDVLRLRVLDPAMGSGAFLVATCRYLADQVERALVDEGSLPRDPTRAERAAIRRLVAQRCVFGVDLNPMAVQLARLSLWLASLSSDHPLTFLDHHLACGDTLIGASLADLSRGPEAARRAITGALPLFELDSARTFAAIMPTRLRLALAPDDTPRAVHDKERALADLRAQGSPLARWKDAADLWCAGWFSPMTRGVFHDVLAGLVGGRGALSSAQHDGVMRQVRALAATHRFCHWELEFPEVFFTEEGAPRHDRGFDAVLGNPPWDMLRADLGDRTQRDDTRRDQRAKLKFFRESRIYRLQSGGHANRYQLFVERALQLVKRGGRLALILPSGLATDHGCAGLRHALLTHTRVDRLLGFDNRAAIFPIHRDVRFLLLTATADGATDVLPWSCGHSDASWLDRLPDDSADDPPVARGVAIARASLERWDPEHLAVPWLTRDDDLRIFARVSDHVPVLSAGNGWRVRFGRELNATEDRRHFVARATAGAVIPVIGGKHLEPFRIDVGASDLAIPAARAGQVVDRDRTFGRARIAYRDVASATNRLTLIAARLPAGVLSTHTVFCSRDALGADAQYCLLALLNSLVANYLVRRRVTTHVTTAVMARLPVPRPATRSPQFAELATLARALETTGIAGGEEQYARLNAIAASLYGLTPDEYKHVLSTFPLLPAALRTRCAADHVRASETQRHRGNLSS
jgi:hypothetical protein